MDKPRICIYGIDGLGYENLKKFDNKGIFHNVYWLVKRSHVSTPYVLPPYTPPSWTTIFTGVNPGKHGVYGYRKPILNKGRLSLVKIVSSVDVGYPRIFEMLSYWNLKGIVINVPLTYPFKYILKKENMIIVSEWLAPRQEVWPPSLSKKLEPLPSLSSNRSIENIFEYKRNRIGVYYNLIEEWEWDYIVVVFSSLDLLLHIHPQLLLGSPKKEAIKTLELIDEFIEKTRRYCDKTIIVSDHGFEEKNVYISINSLLRKYGLLRFTYQFGSKSKPHLGGQVFKTSRRSYINLFISKLNGLITLLWKLSPKLAERFLNFAIRRLPISTNVDPQVTKAIMLDPSSWGLYVFDHDVVERVKELILKSIGKYISGILDSQKIFNGYYVNQLPELIVIPLRKVAFHENIFGETVTFKHGYLDHSHHSLIAIYDDHCDVCTETIREDIVPIVLRYYGLPIPHDTDSRIVTRYRNDYIRRYNYFNIYTLFRRAIKRLYRYQ